MPRHILLTQSAANIGRLAGDVVLHEGLECLTKAVNCLRRFKPEAIGQLFVRRSSPGSGLIHEGSQHAPPIKLIAQELLSLKTSATVVTKSRNA